MKTSVLEFDLGFDGSSWICRNESYEFKAPELEELDEQIIRLLKTGNQGNSCTVRMHFDMRDIPAWIHQYMPHYFNREFTVQLT